MRRRRTLRAALFGALVLAGCAPSEPVLPNVVLVSLDTLRADRLPIYGHDRDTSPSLTALANSGAVFENAYAQAPSTMPTHASLFTGRYPFQHGMYAQGHWLRDREQTLAEYLRGHGYRTVAVASSVRFRDESGYAQGFDSWRTVEYLHKNRRSAAVTHYALEALAAETEAPFFAFVHYFDAHAPYAPPEPFRSLWHAGLETPRPEDTVEFMAEHREPEQPVDPATLEYLRALYDASIRFQDEALAKLLGGLAQAPNGRPTLWVVTSDHGEGFKEHGVLMHARYLHEELLRVPLVMALPGTIAAGQRIERPVQSVDVFPTVVELLGLAAPDGISGRSIAAELRGREPGERSDAAPAKDVIVVESPQSWGLIATLEAGRFKWVTGRETGLFRLDEDPTADRDISARYPEEAAELVELASRMGLPEARDAWKRARARRRAQLDPEVAERLEALGYADEVESAEP